MSAGWLDGRRVLVPRGGELGERLGALLREHGADAVIAPAIEFGPPTSPAELAAALERLAAGDYDWLAVTSATTADVLAGARVRVPAHTRIAAVGAATAWALRELGYTVAFVPSGEHSAAGMVAEWPGETGTVLLPQSAIAGPTLADGLAERGLTVETVEAYTTVALPLDPAVVDAAASGEYAAILLTSGSVASSLAEQLTPLHPDTVVAVLGTPTERSARDAGLPVHVRAASNSAESLIEALVNWRP